MNIVKDTEKNRWDINDNFEDSNFAMTIELHVANFNAAPGYKRQKDVENCVGTRRGWSTRLEKNYSLIYHEKVLP